jgi:hypothetical protein
MSDITLPSLAVPYTYERLDLFSLDENGEAFGMTLYIGSTDNPVFQQGSTSTGSDLQDATDSAAAPFT